MDIRLEHRGNTWKVKLDRHAVSFRSEAEARQFVQQLQARVNAPHPWPGAKPDTALAG